MKSISFLCKVGPRSSREEHEDAVSLSRKVWQKLVQMLQSLM
jgi:hypothetical protein